MIGMKDRPILAVRLYFETFPPIPRFSTPYILFALWCHHACSTTSRASLDQATTTCRHQETCIANTKPREFLSLEWPGTRLLHRLKVALSFGRGSDMYKMRYSRLSVDPTLSPLSAPPNYTPKTAGCLTILPDTKTSRYATMATCRPTTGKG